LRAGGSYRSSCTHVRTARGAGGCAALAGGWERADVQDVGKAAFWFRCRDRSFRWKGWTTVAVVSLVALIALDAAAANVERALTSARKAAAAGRTAEADRLYREVLRVDPKHDAAYAGLVKLEDARALSADSDVFRATKALLPPSFYTYETRRFIVLSNSDRTWTQSQAERLEQTHHQFMRFCRRTGLKPLPLQHKLVCVLFDDRLDYQTFARDHDSVETPWIAGYYSPTNDRVVFYNVHSNPSVIEARERLAQMEDEIAEVERDAAKAARTGRSEQLESLRSLRDQYREHVRKEGHRVDAFASRVSVSTTTHEAIHMLLFHTRVQTPFVQYPLWACEGLATNFETGDSQTAFGPSFDYAPRREPFQQMLANRELLPLRDLIALSELPSDGDEMARVLYHQSYALVHWMCRYRKSELVRYLELMCEEPEGQVAAQRHVQIFESAFGPVADIERRWLRDERQNLTAQATATVTTD
jgi:hypothetical protein